MQTEWVDRVAAMRGAGIPDAVRAVMRRSLMDTLGVAAVGAQTENARITGDVAEMLWASGTAGHAGVLFRGGALSPAGAAFAGAATVDAIDAHDGSTPCQGHAGSAVVPALLAIADAEASSGRSINGEKFLAAMAQAYEVSYRVGRAQHATVSDYHTSGAWTAVGIAVSAAILLGCTPEQIRHAAGIAEYHGPRSQMMRCIDHPTMLRDGVCWGAPTGVTAAYMARAGFTGAPALTIEGDDAAPFWEGFSGANEDEKPACWRIIEETHYKAYPVCRWAHPALDAVADLMRTHTLASDDIARIEVRTFEKAVRLAGRAPTTLDELSYAIIYPLATMAVRGQIGTAELTPAVLTDPAIRDLADRITITSCPELTARSVNKRWADVTIVTRSGAMLASGPRTPRGDRDAPLSEAELENKYTAFAVPILGADRARRIADAARAIDTLDVDAFAQLRADVTAPVSPANAQIRPPQPTKADPTVSDGATIDIAGALA